MRDVFIVLNKLSPVESAAIEQLEGSTILFLDSETYESFRNKSNTQLTSISDEIKKRVNYDVMDKLKSLPEIEIEGKAILSYFSTGNFNFWYYNRFRIYYTVRNAMYFNAFIEQQKLQYSKIHVYSNDSATLDYFADDRDVQVSYVKPASAKRKIDFRYLRIFASSLFVRTFTGLFKLRAFRKKKHAVLTHSSQFSISGKGRSTKLTNNFYGKILSFNDSSDKAVIDYLFFPKLRGENIPVNPKILRKRTPYLKIGGEFIIFYYALLRPGAWKKTREQSKNLLHSYGLISNIKTPIHRMMLTELKHNHTSSLLFYMQYLAFQRLFRNSALQTITSIDENSSTPKSILDAAKSQNIKTLGIQHGSIHNLHPSYIYGEHESRYKPYPDLTFLWGKYFHRLLQNESCYTPHALKVIGQLRTDLVFEADFQANNPCKDFLSPEKTTIVFASQPQRDLLLRRKAAVEVLKATVGIENVQLVIKVHPNEEKDYYKLLASELKIPAIIVKSEIDLLHLIQRANVVITCFSTVGAEAVFMRTPLIVLDHLEQDVLGYIEKNVGIKATCENELNLAIRQLIMSDFKINEQAYDAFIADFAYKVDGQVAERFKRYLFD